MRNPLSLVALSLTALLFASPASAEDFTPLVIGDSLDGWVQRGGVAEYRLEASDEGPVVVGVSVRGTPNSFLCTEREYGDFVLEFETKVAPTLNSGVQFRSEVYGPEADADLPPAEPGKKRRTKAGRVYGYQAEIDPTDRAWSGGVYDESRRGWLAKPDGEDQADARAAFDREGWNHYRVEAIGDSIRTFINGVPIVELTDDETARGFIALQVHSIGRPEQAGQEVRWRKLRIRELTPETETP